LKKKKFPELAIPAIDQGELAARNIMRASRSRKLIPYTNQGLKDVMIIIGTR
jgi:hypothetical protein